MEIDATTLAVLGAVTLQAIQLAQTAVLGRVVRKSLRPPPPSPTVTPVVFEGEENESDDLTPHRRVRKRS